MRVSVWLPRTRPVSLSVSGVRHCCRLLPFAAREVTWGIDDIEANYEIAPELNDVEDTDKLLAAGAS